MNCELVQSKSHACKADVMSSNILIGCKSLSGCQINIANIINACRLFIFFFSLNCCALLFNCFLPIKSFSLLQIVSQRSVSTFLKQKINLSLKKEEEEEEGQNICLFAQPKSFKATCSASNNCGVCALTFALSFYFFSFSLFASLSLSLQL